MLDIKWIRENPQDFNAAMEKRGNQIKASDLLKIDEEKRKKTALIQELQSQRNKIAKDIAEVKRSGGNVEALLEQSNFPGSASHLRDS